MGTATRAGVETELGINRTKTGESKYKNNGRHFSPHNIGAFIVTIPSRTDASQTVNIMRKCNFNQPQYYLRREKLSSPEYIAILKTTSTPHIFRTIFNARSECFFFFLQHQNLQSHYVNILMNYSLASLYTYSIKTTNYTILHLAII